MALKITEIKAKSILNPSKLGCNFAINPYTGCGFGCAYCYAIFMSRLRHQDEKWGEWVDVKINAPELLKEELKKKRPGTILFSSVTDPYQQVEAKYKITRSCLEILAENDYQAPISILTKSPLVTRDIDLFKKLNVEVGITVTSTGDPITQILETNAPPNQVRLNALEKLSQSSIATYAFVGPLLPHLAEKPGEIEKLFKNLKKAGVKDIWVEHLNLSPYIKRRLYLLLAQRVPNQLSKFRLAESQEYRKKLDKVLDQILKKIKFSTAKIIHH